MRVGLVLGEVWNGLRRNMSVVISVILVTFVSLTFVGAAIIMQLQVQQMKTFWYDRAQVAVYLCTDYDQSATCAGTDAGEAEIAAVEEALKSDTLAPYVDDFFFVDHEQALEEFTKQFKGNPIVEITKADQLNQTFWIKLTDPDRSDIITETFSGIPGVQSVSDQRSLLDRIFLFLGVASYTAIAIAGLMLVAAMLLISTTIRLSAFSRRREIGIMRLVGASNRFIQTPFILEGIISALIGAVLASVASVSIVKFFVQGFLAKEIPFTSYITVEQSLIVPPVLILVSVLLSSIAAKIAITRYLRV
ncbi:permease-like cell division protein FtsX [Leucobacter luti]|uniref:Cell division protein FtsX n=1 Tax=Leucobacter luti TaxID=340320 RepID=A0A4R6S571_9MICO|nr:permease-like cell division protein FtsX [Leucobacter luti]MCW2287276.1 cell division transport system permease protein [Leucobacter luti]QYM76653.1 permease-like cell division protein FtsX [Leucobacter luti]TCK41499.1 cell division protein FtsX [Leucobacter luti]TDP94473.1 cell division protein FtsX [Leucobacter luti]